MKPNLKKKHQTPKNLIGQNIIWSLTASGFSFLVISFIFFIYQKTFILASEFTFIISIFIIFIVTSISVLILQYILKKFEGHSKEIVEISHKFFNIFSALLTFITIFVKMFKDDTELSEVFNNFENAETIIIAATIIFTSASIGYTLFDMIEKYKNLNKTQS